MVTKLVLSTTILALSMAGGTASADRKMPMKPMPMHSDMSDGQMKMMAGWPKASREAVDYLTRKYGAPAAVTADEAVWGKAGPWKRSVVYRVEVPHDFPGPHTDVMQQWLDYKVPTSMYDELAMFDGSVVVERTAGEMSARCDKEGANLLAVNLADAIVTGKMTVDAARTKYGEQIMLMKAGKSAPYTEKLMFSPAGDTRDPDHPVMAMKAKM